MKAPANFTVATTADTSCSPAERLSVMDLLLFSCVPLWTAKVDVLRKAPADLFAETGSCDVKNDTGSCSERAPGHSACSDRTLNYLLIPCLLAPYVVVC